MSAAITLAPEARSMTGSSPDPRLRVRDVTMSFGTFTAVRNVDLDVADGEFLAIVGPTGCGKSTILNAIAGLLKPASGEITLGGRPVAGINTSIGYLFQQDALLPWKTAIENVELGLVFKGEAPELRRPKALAWMEKVGLKGFEGRYPHQLSGGQRKRVQLAQALISDPQMILMDEPFSALDIHTRHLMQTELLRLWQENRKSVVLITHDLEEAISLGDRVVVLAAGPASRVVADYPVDLPRPRNVSEIMMDPRFMDLYRSIWSSLKNEVEKSYAQHK